MFVAEITRPPILPKLHVLKRFLDMLFRNNAGFFDTRCIHFFGCGADFYLSHKNLCNPVKKTVDKKLCAPYACHFVLNKKHP
ncbi:MAG: hypothetical protein LBE04_01720 [Prevotellaceae bacterium]|jgi:hypothetical protein|nr:hypothetical protein [Prevotellaceae bacterium]